MRILASTFGLAIGLAAIPAAAQQSSTDVVVVTASRTEQTQAEAPVAISVITALDIERTPADDVGDLLRNQPGINVAQTSARDVNVTGRGSTNTLANSLLTLMDGRSTYLDFFGINMWDLLPNQPEEIAQIEVVRGPGSALYGANAMSGVVNIITKRPKDMTGTSVVIGTPYANVIHAAGDDDFAYKVSAGYFDHPAYDRPTGIIPGSNPATPFPPYRNEGTTQRRVNTRFDWGLEDNGYVSFGAGLATTDGIVHTGIGPFDIDSDTELAYWQADWHRDQLHIGLSMQMLDGDATNLLTRDTTGQPLGFRFINDTLNAEVSNTNVVGDRHVITYGGNFRTHDFDLTIAPQASSKDEIGIFVQDDIRLTDNLRWVVGLRYDDIDPLRDTVLTPRTSLVYSLAPEHAIRVSYNEAFRTPSTINSFLDVSILQPLDPQGQIVVAGDADGNVDLVEESLKAYEVGYVGTINNNTQLSVSVYRNETTDSIDFFEAGFYGPTNPPTPFPGWPPGFATCFLIPPGTSGLCPEGGLAGVVPAAYSYRNIGKTIDKGVEFSIEQKIASFLGDNWYWWANASWQDDPEIEGADVDEVNRAPEWRANFGIGQDLERMFWNLSVNYQDESFWSDVLYAKAATDGFTQVNGSVGWRIGPNDMTLKLIGQNLFDEELQQHIFGDIIDRRVTAQLSFSF